MKKNIILLCLLLFSQLLYAQNPTLVIGQNKFDLLLDSTLDVKDVFRYLSKSNQDRVEINFENVPTNKYIQSTALDTIEIVDDITKFYCGCIDTLNSGDVIPFELQLRDTTLTDISFQYIVLGEGMRISSKFTETILTGSEGGKKLAELINSAPKGGGVILSAIDFYDGKKKHLLNFGYTCLINKGGK